MPPACLCACLLLEIGRNLEKKCFLGQLKVDQLRGGFVYLVYVKSGVASSSSCCCCCWIRLFKIQTMKERIQFLCAENSLYWNKNDFVRCQFFVVRVHYHIGTRMFVCLSVRFSVLRSWIFSQGKLRKSRDSEKKEGRMVLKGDIDYFFGCPSFQGKDISEESSSRPLLAGHFSIFARSVLEGTAAATQLGGRGRGSLTGCLVGSAGLVFLQANFGNRKKMLKKRREVALWFTTTTTTTPNFHHSSKFQSRKRWRKKRERRRR